MFFHSFMKVSIFKSTNMYYNENTCVFFAWHMFFFSLKLLILNRKVFGVSFFLTNCAQPDIFSFTIVIHVHVNDPCYQVHCGHQLGNRCTSHLIYRDAGYCEINSFHGGSILVEFVGSSHPRINKKGNIVTFPFVEKREYTK